MVGSTQQVIQQIAQELFLPPVEGQVILARALEIPLPGPESEIMGIHQSDIVIRSGLEMAMQDMRANPWLLDRVFAGIARDTLTWKEYGEKAINAAKQWFLKTDIPIKMAPVMNDYKLPCITIALVDSTEVTSEATLGDIHTPGTESDSTTWPALTNPFTPRSYSPSTGLVVLPNLPPNVFVGPGMFIIDNVGREHEILDVIDGLSFYISSGTVANFKGAILKGRKPAWVTSIESSSFRETYRIGCHVGSEPTKLTWLHSVVVFALLRYKEVLLEARGFERSTIQSSDFSTSSKEDTEQTFTRYVTCTGNVRHYWPKMITQAIDVVQIDALSVSGVVAGSQLGVVRPNTTPGPDVRIEDTGVDPDTQGWVGNLDILDPTKRK